MNGTFCGQSGPSEKGIPSYSPNNASFPKLVPVKGFSRWLPILAAVFAVVLILPSCGWDDDTEYEIRTRASYLIGEDPITGNQRVWRYQAGVLQEGWNRDYGIQDGDFSGLQYRNGELWMGDASASRILRIDPTLDAIEEEFKQLPIQPHFFSVGERWILLGDTIQDQIAFVRLRNGESVIAEFSGKPGPVHHNNRLFFLQVGDSSVHVYDEWALTPRHQHTLSYPVRETQFNTLLNFFITLVDSAGQDYFALVSGTDGSLAVESDDVSYQKIRFSPYLEDRFGTEWLSDLRLEGSQLTSGAITFADSMNNFETDFFESHLFYSWHDSLFYFDLNTQTRLDSFPFTDRLISSVHWVGGE